MAVRRSRPFTDPPLARSVASLVASSWVSYSIPPTAFVRPSRRYPSGWVMVYPFNSWEVARDWAFALSGCIRAGAIDGWWLVSIPITAFGARMFRCGMPTVFALSASHLPQV